MCLPSQCTYNIQPWLVLGLINITSSSWATWSLHQFQYVFIVQLVLHPNHYHNVYSHLTLNIHLIAYQ